MQSLLKFFPKKEAVRDEVFEEVQNFATAAAAKQLKEARRKRGETPWASWPPQKKQALAEELASGLSWSAFKVLCVRVFLHLVGAFPLQLRHAEEEMPPESTLRGWRAKAKYGRVLLAPGRPSTLSTLEETVVMEPCHGGGGHEAIACEMATRLDQPPQDQERDFQKLANGAPHVVLRGGRERGG